MKSFDCPTGGFRTRESGNRWAILIKGLRPFILKNIPEGDITEIRVVRTAKRVNVLFVVEQELDVTPSDTDFVCFDLGIANLAMFSNGKKIKDCKLNLKSRIGKIGKSRDHLKAKRWGWRNYRSVRSLFSMESKRLLENQKFTIFVNWYHKIRPRNAQKLGIQI